MPAQQPNPKLGFLTRRRKTRTATLELLESRALLTATPTIEIARDRGSPGFTFEFAGTADPFATVQVNQVGGAIAGETTADAGGQWQLTYAGAQLAQGEFRFQAIAADALGEISEPSPDAVYRPNLVLVNADDMAARDLAYMPLVNQLLVGSGTTFTNSFTPTSVSGPSRAALMTGQYAHTNGVFEAFAPLGGAVNLDATSTFATWLHDVGYRTGMYGKSETSPDNVESSRPELPPPGWDEFSNFSGFVQYKDGVKIPVPYKFDVDSTAVWQDLAERFVEENGGDDSPFLLYLAPTVSHRPYVPRAEYLGTMNGVPAWRPPSYNLPPPYLTELNAKPNIDNWDMQRQRHLETLQSIDQAVSGIYESLVATGDLDNTVFVFTSDNGLLWGEHAMFSNKDNFFEESLRVPLVVRDGRMPLAQIVSQTALNIDIAPTFARLAGILPPAVDGVDLSPVVHGSNETTRTSFVLEHQWNEGYDFTEFGYGRGGVGIRTDTWKYVEYETGLRELFNLEIDPFEMNNLASDSQYTATQQSLARQLHDMLPADDQGPVVTALSQHVEFNDAGLPLLRIEGAATDDNSGGSQIRSPEYYIDHLGTQGWGQPLDHADGLFNSSTEPFRGMIPVSKLAQLGGGSHVLYIRARDVAGNWGEAVSIPFQLLSRPLLDAGSDNGDSNSDGLTLDGMPVLHGASPANATIALFAVQTDSTLLPVGNATADSLGNWTTTAKLPAGDQKIVAVVTDPLAESVSFTAALPIHVAGLVQPGNWLNIVGGSTSDEITADGSVDGILNVIVNGVSAGLLAWSGPVQIDGLAGNDRLAMLGNLPATLIGGTGDDVLLGGGGNDWLEGDTGINQLVGGLGDDKYVFTVNEDLGSTDTVAELPGQGYDTLDFSRLPIPLSLTWGAAVLARYTARSNLDRVMAAAGSALSYECIRGGSGADVIAVPASVRLNTGKGNDRVTLQTRLNRNDQVPLPVLGGQDGNDEVRAVLTATQGVLSLDVTVPGGVTADQILGNGTAGIQITATPAQIRTTWNAPHGIRYLARDVTPGSATVDAKLYSLSDGAELELDSATFVINSPPVLSLSGTRSYREQAAAVRVAPTATVQDAEGNFGGGQLTVAVTANVDVNDRLSIQNQGTASGQVGVSGSQITIGGALRGTFSGGSGGIPLVIQLTSGNVSAAMVQILARAITYANGSDAPLTSLRTITFELTDGDGGRSQAVGMQVNVIAVNDAPVVTGSSALGWSTHSGSPNPTEFSISALLPGSFDPDGNAVQGIAVTVASEFSGRWQYTLNGGSSWLSCKAPTTQAALLLPATAATRLRFVPNSGFQGQVRLWFLAWDRTQGVAGSTADVSTTSKTGGSTAFSRATASASVTVLPPSKDPSLIFSGTVGYVHDRAAIVLTPYATVSDVDSPDFAGGQLRVRIGVGASSSNRLAIAGAFTVDAANNVLLDGTIIGRRISNGFGVNDLIVTFNSAATPSIVQKLVRAITFKTVGGSPGQRSVLFSVSDGEGGYSDELAKIVNVS